MTFAFLTLVKDCEILLSGALRVLSYNYQVASLALFFFFIVYWNIGFAHICMIM